MTDFTVSGLVDGYRIEKNITAASIHHAIKLFEGMYHRPRNVYVVGEA